MMRKAAAMGTMNGTIGVTRTTPHPWDDNLAYTTPGSSGTGTRMTSPPMTSSTGHTCMLAASDNGISNVVDILHPFLRITGTMYSIDRIVARNRTDNGKIPRGYASARDIMAFTSAPPRRMRNQYIDANNANRDGDANTVTEPEVQYAIRYSTPAVETTGMARVPDSSPDSMYAVRSSDAARMQNDAPWPIPIGSDAEARTEPPPATTAQWMSSTSRLR